MLCTGSIANLSWIPASAGMTAKLCAALMTFGLSQPLLAAIEITPNHVTVGKEHVIELKGKEAQRIKQVTLLPGGPQKLRSLPLTAGKQGDYTLQSQADGLHLMQQMGPEQMEVAHFGSHAIGAESNDAQLKIENNNELVLTRAGKTASRYRASAALHDVVVIGELAVLANDRNGVTVLDINDAEKPLWRGSHQKLGRIIRVVAADDNALALSDGGIVYLIDLKNPAEPTVINAWRSNGNVRDLAWFDQTVYLRSENNIDVIDFSAPMPQISNEGLNFGQGVNFGGERRVDIVGNVAYVADWFSGIHLYDISNPNLPLLLSSFHTPGSPKGMIVRDNVAYVPDDDHGLQIIDVADPRAPKLISHIQTAGLGYTPKLQGDLLYLASHRGGFQIIDVKDPANPQQLSEIDTPGKAWSLAVQNDKLYVADDDTGLLIFDVKDPKAPKQIGQFTPGTAAEEVLIRDNIAFVAFFDDGLYILDIADPAAPKVISHTTLPGNSRGLDLIGDKLYVASWLAGIHILDVSDLQTPQILGSYDTRGATWGLKVVNDHLYAMDWWGGVAVLDVSDATNPHVVGDYHERGRVNDVTAREYEGSNYAFAAQGNNGLQIFDIKNQLNPTWITGINFPGDARRVVLAGNHAYLAMGDGGLAIANIDSPFEAQWLSTTTTDGRVTDLVIDGKRAWLLDELQGVLLYDIGNPKQPRQLARIDIKASAIAQTGNGVIAAADDGLHHYSVDGGGKVVQSAHLPLKEGAQKLLVKDATLYAAFGNTLQLFALANNAIKAKSHLRLAAPIMALAHEGKHLLISNEREVMQLDPATLKITNRYPLLSGTTSMRLHQGVLYMGGAQTITALRLLPEISLRHEASNGFTLPATTAIGSYHLLLTYGDGKQQQLDNAIRVEMPKFAKPKMSMDEFKKLLEEKRKNSDLFSAPK